MRINVQNSISKAQEISDFSLSHKNKIEVHIHKAQKDIENFLTVYGGSGIDYMHYTPSVFEISKNDEVYIQDITLKFHSLIEKIFDAIANGHPATRDFFSKHQRFFPYFKKLKTFWQGYGRYDFLVDQAGRIQFIETNASGGTGFFYLQKFHKIATDNFECLNFYTAVKEMHSYENIDFFSQQLLEMEEKNDFQPMGVAVLHDHNNPSNHDSIQSVELAMMREAFMRNGRFSKLASVGEIEFKQGKIWLHRQPISLSFNKCRLSDRYGSWDKATMLQYDSFLKGIAAGCFQPINSIPCLTVGEDKSILAVLSDDFFTDLFTFDEQEFIQNHIPWTRRLVDGLTSYKKHQMNLVECLEKNKNDFVIKPENDRRGSDVFIGRDLDQESWNLCIKKNLGRGFVVQSYIHPIFLPIVYQDNSEVISEELAYTGSVYHLNGKFSGILSRVSTENVMNVRSNGFVLPTMVM